jgi:uncharacterized protein YndB with AHSA1/START domain
MPGDELVEGRALQTTRAVTIEAAPERVWAWLVQMGPRPRAGAYTYDWMERRLGIDIENRNRILPEFQHLEAGEVFALDDEHDTGLAVRHVEEGKHLVLQWVPTDSTWTFALYPDGDGGTRLVSRNRIPAKGAAWRLAMAAFMEPGSLVMERKMLLTLKERAEGMTAEDLEAAGLAAGG